MVSCEFRRGDKKLDRPVPRWRGGTACGVCGQNS